MICPVCRAYQSSEPMQVARHMMGKFDKTHIYWMEAHGLNPVMLLAPNGKSDYKPLAELLEKLASGRS